VTWLAVAPPGTTGRRTISLGRLISNTTPLAARIYANEGIAQVVFFEGDEAPETSYKDKAGNTRDSTASRCRRSRRLILAFDGLISTLMRTRIERIQRMKRI